MNHYNWCHSPFYEDVKIAPVIINQYLDYKDYKCRGTGHDNYRLCLLQREGQCILCPEENIAFLSGVVNL
ncbi:MAG: hypothetical protein ACFFCZ_30610 [Promethearchaeota archaeon]